MLIPSTHSPFLMTSMEEGVAHPTEHRRATETSFSVGCGDNRSVKAHHSCNHSFSSHPLQVRVGPILAAGFLLPFPLSPSMQLAGSWDQSTCFCLTTSSLCHMEQVCLPLWPAVFSSMNWRDRLGRFLHTLTFWAG